MSFVRHTSTNLIEAYEHPIMYFNLVLRVSFQSYSYNANAATTAPKTMPSPPSTPTFTTAAPVEMDAAALDADAAEAADSLADVTLAMLPVLAVLAALAVLEVNSGPGPSGSLEETVASVVATEAEVTVGAAVVAGAAEEMSRLTPTEEQRD